MYMEQSGCFIIVYVGVVNEYLSLSLSEITEMVISSCIKDMVNME